MVPVACGKIEAAIALVIHWLTLSPTTPTEKIAAALVAGSHALLDALAPRTDR